MMLLSITHAALLALASAQVETTSGPVVGRAPDEHGVRSYLGIPYAAPPVGELRWAPAVPPEPWSAPLHASEHSLAAVQREPRSYEGIGERGEDCLYLNVYAPARAAGAPPAPVLVWIHGGGFVSGTAMSANYEGSVLARDGVCVVVPNYRLGPLGFLAHPALSAESGSSGNQALSDLALALEWVRDNSLEFGGDPENVTLAGQSSGASAVTALMCCERVAGLFHKAAVHSGGAAHGLRSLEDGEEFGLAFARALGVEGDGADALQALRAFDATDLLEAWSTVQAEHGRFDLCVDGTLLRQSPADSFRAGEQTAVPLLVGATADESSMFMLRGGAEDLEAYHAWMEERFGELTEEALEVYPAADLDQARAMQVQYGNDVYATYARGVARAAALQAPTWRYRFTRVSPLGESLRMGSFHGSDVAYLFGRVAEGESYTQEDVRLSALLRAYWTAFCREGDPNGEDLTAWPAYELDSEPYLVLDTELGQGSGWRGAACDLIDAAWFR